MQLSDVRPKSSSNEMAIEKKLNEPITLNFKDHEPSDEAITFIRNYTGLNVALDPKALNDEGLSKDSKVSLQANSIKLKSALKFMLRPLGLTYKADDDVLLITSPQATRGTRPTHGPTRWPTWSSRPTRTTPGPASMPALTSRRRCRAPIPSSLHGRWSRQRRPAVVNTASNAGQRVVTEADMHAADLS